MVKGELKSKKEHKREVFRTFSLSQMSNVELARTLSWRENTLLGEQEKNNFPKAIIFSHKALCKVTQAFILNNRAIPQTNYFRLQTQLAVNCQLLVFFLVAVFFVKYDNYILQNAFCLLVLLGEKEAFLARNQPFFRSYTFSFTPFFRAKPAFCTIQPFYFGCQLVIFQVQLPAFFP